MNNETEFGEYLECLDTYNVRVKQYKEAMVRPNGTLHRVAKAEMDVAAVELKDAFDIYVRTLLGEEVLA